MHEYAKNLDIHGQKITTKYFQLKISQNIYRKTMEEVKKINNTKKSVSCRQNRTENYLTANFIIQEKNCYFRRQTGLTI